MRFHHKRWTFDFHYDHDFDFDAVDDHFNEIIDMRTATMGGISFKRSQPYILKSSLWPPSPSLPYFLTRFYHVYETDSEIILLPLSDSHQRQRNSVCECHHVLQGYIDILKFDVRKYVHVWRNCNLGRSPKNALVWGFTWQQEGEGGFILLFPGEESDPRSALWRKPLSNMEIRSLPKWWPWLPFSQARIISDEIFGCHLLCSFIFN